MQQGPAVCIKTSICWGLRFWNAAHVAAAGQHAPCRGVSQHIPSAPASDRDKRTKVTPISDRASFFRQSPPPPAVKEIIRLSNVDMNLQCKRAMGSVSFCPDLRSRSQTEDIKTCSISPALPCPDRGLPVPNRERTKRVGDGNCGIAVITRALRIFHFNLFFFTHAIVIVIRLLWARVKICWCEDKVLKRLNVFFVLASCWFNRQSEL